MLNKKFCQPHKHFISLKNFSVQNHIFFTSRLIRIPKHQLSVRIFHFAQSSNEHGAFFRAFRFSNFLWKINWKKVHENVSIKSRDDFLFKATVPNFIDAQRNIPVNLPIIVIYCQFKFVAFFHRLDIRNNVLVMYKTVFSAISCRQRKQNQNGCDAFSFQLFFSWKIGSV